MFRIRTSAENRIREVICKERAVYTVKINDQTRMKKHDIKLSSRHTIADYARMEKRKNRSGISALIELRLRERYVDPLERSAAKNGFASMALGCLLIETLQSFREGRCDTKWESRKIFERHFNQNPRLIEFAPCSTRFYLDVRCGLLHQGEARNGWTIVRFRDEPLFDKKKKCIHATRFLRRVNLSVRDYCLDLVSAEWRSELWENCRQKMSAIISNSEEAHPF
jgi:hypothetical protein